MSDPTAMTDPLTQGQKIVAAYERDMIAEPCELAEMIDRELALEYERGKMHGADDRRLIEAHNRSQGREIDRLKGEIARLKRDLYTKAEH